MPRVKIVLLGLPLLLLIVGCAAHGTSERGFRLPEGNLENGKTAFLELKCHTCHTIHDLELPKTASESPYDVVLGGEVRRVKTYGQLLTAIIHPSHRLVGGVKKEQLDGGELSPMPEYNHIMTVEQMIDVVAFLESQYELSIPDYHMDP